MAVKDAAADPVTLQLLKLSVRKKDAVVAACDSELRYTHLFNPHPSFSADESLGKRDDELASASAVAELLDLKREVLELGREVQRRVHVEVSGVDRVYDTTAEPIHDATGAVVGVATAAIDVTPTLDVQALLRRVSERLESQVEQITLQWHEELGYRLNVRPQNVFPSDDLLDGVPEVVRWLARSLLDGDVMSAAESESLRELAVHWRRSGYSIEESLVHVRVLTDLLLDAVASATEEAGDGVRPSAGVEATRRLAGALDVLKVVFVATYRDAEEDRFGDFGATLAHEVRGHIASAVTGTEVLQLLGPEEERKREQLLERVAHALEQANRVVTSVQTLSRAARDGNRAWSYRPLDALADEVVAQREGGQHVRVEVAEDLPSVQVPAEPVQLILHNLVDNAVKYSNPDASPRWVRIHAVRSDGDGHMTVHVGDNGLGIPEEEQERIFLRFRRGQEATGDGFGLGLAIVRETARTFGGKILLESEPGRGSTFSFTIPADQLRS